MKKKIIGIITTAFVVCTALFSACNNRTPVLSQSIRALSPIVESEVNLANDDVAEFVQNYEKEYSILYYGKGDRFKMQGVTLNFEADEPARYYNVLVSRYPDMRNAQTQKTQQPTAHFDDLFVNTTYYWQVYANYRTQTLQSETFSFTTADTPRTIHIDGVSNTRDVGGKKTLDGKRIKQGMLYRAATLDSITKNGKGQAKNVYGIKTEIDLRRLDEVGNRTVSPIGRSVEFIHISAPYYVGDQNGIDNPNNHESIRRYMQVFADESKYPILFHCSAGRDRTGMAALFLQGLLGVSERDIFIDYEMSFFSLRGCMDGANVSLMVSFFTNAVNYIQNNFGTENDSFARKCELFLLHVGVTEQEIASIRHILLEN